MAETTYEYDDHTTPDGYHAQLVSRPGISGLCDGSPQNCPNGPNFTDFNYKTRGNVTKVSRWLNTPSGTVNTYQQYDVAGNVVKLMDANGNAAQLDFRDNFGSPDNPTVQSGGNPANNAPGPLGGQTSYAFPFKVTNALGHIAYTKYDYYLGGPVLSEDPNNIKSSAYFDDALDRSTKGIHAVGTAAANQTVFVYNDSSSTVNGNPPHSITTISDKDIFGESTSGNGLKSLALYDGLGRRWRSATYEGNTGPGNTWAITDAQFDALGRVSQVSNPYRAADPGAASTPSGTWTTTVYDALSRLTTVQTPDTAVVTTIYSGNVVTITDQAGKLRRSLTDGLGRLIRVDEPDASNNLGAVSNPVQPTYYTYDALDNLRRVQQGVQTRWFAYDSLSRLIYAKNPERTTNAAFVYTDNMVSPANSQWSIKYQYDLNGNLTEKTDARNIKITYVYDALNRNTTVDYDNTPTINPDITRVYDNTTAGANGKGRFWHDYAGGHISTGQNVEHKAIDSYDALGRPLSMRQLFKLNGTWSNGFITSQTYDRAGHVKSITYPSGRVVNYSYDTAGQLASFTGKLGGLTGAGGSDVNYATGMQYNPRGQRIRETFGTNTALYHRKHYNRRGQIFDIRLGTDGSSGWDVEDPLVWRWENGTWNRGAIRLYFSASRNDYDSVNPSQPDNNGNIHGMEHFVPNALNGSGIITSWVMGSDAYLYDELNRLTRVTEIPAGGSGPGFVQQFIYDRWGNRKIDTAATSNVNGGVTDIDFKVLTANNRLVAPTDTTGDDPGTDLMRYDKAGNLIWDNYSPDPSKRGSMEYDAENRMIKAVSNAHQYRYDADGKRTRRLVASSPEMWLVYGVNGELVAEYEAVMPGGTLKKEYGYRGGQMLIVYDGTQMGDDQLKWIVTDHLGSTRMLVNRSGSLCNIQRRDYLPFGEELAPNIGHRNASCSGYMVNDNPRQKFTGHERDNETGLDYMQARYFSSVQGRFTSVDPLMASAKTGAPQSWNRFTYALNNPLRYVDPEGMEGIDAWLLLTPDEQAIISSKLETREITDKRGRKRQETYREAFNRIIGTGTDEEIKNMVTLVKNFIDTAGGHTNSAIWQEIKTFNGVWLGQDPDKSRNDPRFHEGGGVKATVDKEATFLDVLKKNGYEVDPRYDRWFNKTAHPNHSAREITNTSWETGAHWSNDDSSNLNLFFLHWDKRSTEFKKASGYNRWGEQRDAGKSHHEAFTATEAREKLRQRGVVPK